LFREAGCKGAVLVRDLICVEYDSEDGPSRVVCGRREVQLTF